MRSATSKSVSSLALLALLAGAGAHAAPTILDWSLDAQGASETIRLRWNEPASVDINEFGQARQLIAVFPGAALGVGLQDRLNTGSSAILDRARLQEVTLRSGEAGLQLTLSLHHWTGYSTTTSDEEFAIVLTVPEPLRPQVMVQQSPGLELTDAKIAELDSRGFGSVSAPTRGAGQGTQPAATPLSEFYVPPQVVRDPMADPSSRTLADLEVQSKLNELVRRVDFQGTTLENVLRLISEEAELNMLLTPSDVAGRTVTLRLRNVTLREMLDAILKANNLGYTIEDGGIVRIVPRDQVKTTVRETETVTIPINWVDATEISSALQPFVNQDEDGLLEVSRGNNALIVRDVPETVKVIQDLVAQIDVPEKQVLIEMRLVNMTESARRAMGVRTGLESQSTANRFIRNPDANFFDLGEFTNVTTDTTLDLQNQINNQFTSNFNRTTPGGLPVLTETNISQNNLQNDFTSTAESVFSSVPSSRGTIGLLAPGAQALQWSNLFSAEIFGANYDVDLAINMQEDRGEAVTLANPSVLSLNNTEALVEIKRRIPYVSAINTEQGSLGTIEFVDVGTTVAILPRITNNGYVMMEIQPEQIIDTGERPGGVPVTDERRVEASVIVRDEQTVALGGLREFVATSSESGVPYLLRLPVLSWLFKRQANSQDKTELYLFVRPQIVKDPTPTAYQQGLYEKIDYNWDLPDYYFDEVYARKAPGEEAGPRARR